MTNAPKFKVHVATVLPGDFGPCAYAVWAGDYKSSTAVVDGAHTFCAIRDGAGTRIVRVLHSEPNPNRLVVVVPRHEKKLVSLLQLLVRFPP